MAKVTAKKVKEALSQPSWLTPRKVTVTGETIDLVYNGDQRSLIVPLVRKFQDENINTFRSPPDITATIAANGPRNVETHITMLRLDEGDIIQPDDPVEDDE